MKEELKINNLKELGGIWLAIGECGRYYDQLKKIDNTFKGKALIPHTMDSTLEEWKQDIIFYTEVYSYYSSISKTSSITEKLKRELHSIAIKPELANMPELTPFK